MSDIERLALVATVARTNGIREAARVHGVSQPTVTRAIIWLEAMVGFEMFARTSEGTTVRRDATRALEIVARIVEGLDELRSLGSDRPAALRFAHTEPVPALLDSAIARWNRENTLRAVLMPCDDPIGAVAAGTASFAVVSGAPTPTGMEYNTLRSIRGLRTDLLYAESPASWVRDFLQFLG